MNSLSVEVSASCETNDHEARIFVDGEDWLGENYLGLDPPRLFSQPELFSGGKARVGRCECGVEGCDDVTVEVVTLGTEVRWTGFRGAPLLFDRQQYQTVLSDKATDHSWEDSNRRVERRVDAVFAGTVLPGGLAFEWSSARIGDGKITLSFSSSEGTPVWRQKLVEFGWDGEDVEAAERRAKTLRVELTTVG